MQLNDLAYDQNTKKIRKELFRTMLEDVKCVGSNFLQSFIYKSSFFLNELLENKINLNVRFKRRVYKLNSPFCIKNSFFYQI